MRTVDNGDGTYTHTIEDADYSSFLLLQVRDIEQARRRILIGRLLVGGTFLIALIGILLLAIMHAN